jgi:DNA-binding NarL/FixJ family response regulator
MLAQATGAHGLLSQNSRKPRAARRALGERVPGKCRILVVDEEGLMRDALCALLAGVKACEVMGAASSGRDALLALDDLRPDTVIVDFTTSMTHGPELITVMREHQPDVRVLVLTFRSEPHFVTATLSAGADGYILKNDSVTELAAAIRSLAAGKRYVSTSIRSRVSDGQTRLSSAPRRAQRAPLTQREREVVKLIAQGYRTREIAQSLSLSHKTVEKHRTNLMRKLGLRTAAAVAAYAVADGYVSR